MGNRRFAQLVMSDDEDESPCVFARGSRPAKDANGGGEAEPNNKRRRIVKTPDAGKERSKREIEEEKKDAGDKNLEDAAGSEEEENGEEAVEEDEDAKPIGGPVRITGKGRGRKEHYEAFEFDGNRYDLVSSGAIAVYPLPLLFR